MSRNHMKGVRLHGMHPLLENIVTGDEGVFIDLGFGDRLGADLTYRRLWFDAETWASIPDGKQVEFLTEYLRATRTDGLQYPVSSFTAHQGVALRRDPPPAVAELPSAGAVPSCPACGYPDCGGVHFKGIYVPGEPCPHCGGAGVSVPHPIFAGGFVAEAGQPVVELEESAGTIEASELRTVLAAIEPEAYVSVDPDYAECRYCEGMSDSTDEALRHADLETQGAALRHAPGCPVLIARSMLAMVDSLGTVNPPNMSLNRDRAGRCAVHQADVCEVCPGDELAAKLRPYCALGEVLQTQDNESTSEPVYLVQQARRIYGLDVDYATEWCWVHEDDPGEEVEPNLAANLEAGLAAGAPTVKGYYRVGYRDTWEYVTACLTRVGAQNYIDRNRHNLRHPRVYIASGNYNSDWMMIRKLLLSLTDGSIPGLKDVQVPQAGE